MLDGARLAISEFDRNLLLFLILSSWLPCLNRRAQWRYRPGFFWLWLYRLTIPLPVAEMMVRLHEIVDREVVLAVVKPRAAPNDLLELNHRIDRTQQHDVA